MKDLTQHSIPKHLLTLSVPIAVGMLVQTMYFLVDLYFIGALGDAAIAGLSMAGNFMFIVLALTQVLNVGTATLIAHAVGRKQQSQANLVFNQSLMLSGFCFLAVLLLGYALAKSYLRLVSDDPAAIDAAFTYLLFFMPCLAIQFPITAIGAALRGTGIVKPTMLVQLSSLGLNIALSPVLISGWGTGLALGIAGAGLASSVSVLAALAMLYWYFCKLERYVSVDRLLWKADTGLWRDLLKIGLPSGGEYLITFAFMAMVYWAIQGFGTDAQAGFGLGVRIVQALLLPALAIAMAAPAIAGQNFGAGQQQRVKQTFYWTVLLTSTLMLLLSILCLWGPHWLFSPFTSDVEVLAYASGFIAITCWNFVPTGVVATCSGMFQALGYTLPALLASFIRLSLFGLPLLVIVNWGHLAIEQVWYLSVTSVFIQALLCLWLLNKTARTRLIVKTTSPVDATAAA